MSSGEIRALRTEIESLRQLLESARLNLTEVRDRVEALETAWGPSSRAGSVRDREETAMGIQWFLRAQLRLSRSWPRTKRAEQNLLHRPLFASLHQRRQSWAFGEESRLYLILADFEGNLVAPRAVKEFGLLLRFAKGDLRVGKACSLLRFATQWEAQLACDKAGIDWPGIWVSRWRQTRERWP